MIFCTFLTSTAQILYKLGAATLQFNLLSILSNYYLITGIILYAFGSLLVLFAFRHGEVTVLYPIVTLSYVWINIGSFYFLNEVLNFYKWFGTGLIIGGIILINLKGAKK